MIGVGRGGGNELSSGFIAGFRFLKGLVDGAGEHGSFRSG